MHWRGQRLTTPPTPTRVDGVTICRPLLVESLTDATDSRPGKDLRHHPGTEVFSTGDGRYYTSRIEADRPDGPFTADSRIIYLAEQKVFTRYEVDSPGFERVVL